MNNPLSLCVRTCVALLSFLLSLGVGTAAQGVVVSGTAEVVGSDIVHPNGNIYDQVLLTGNLATLRAEPGKVTRCSFIDENGDIVQCEFTGPGELTIQLDLATAGPPALPEKYNQDVQYVSGKPTIRLSGNTADTYLTVFSVGSANAVNQTLFKDGVAYDAVADVALIEIAGTELGGLFAGNARFTGSSGMVGILAPNTNIAQRIVLHDIEAAGNAIPVLQVGANSALAWDTGSILLAGGDLAQPNGASIDITAGNGDTFASIVTVANVRSDGRTIQRVTIDAAVTWVSGGKGTLLVDGTAVFDHTTGGTSGSFSANFQDLIAGSDSPFDFGDGSVNLLWDFSGGNSGTWFVESTMVVQGFSSRSRISGTYTYVLSGDASTFTLTMNYEQIASLIEGLPPITLNISSSSNPPLPKSVKVVATRTGPSTGSYVYTLTMSDGKVTEMSGNYTNENKLALPSG